MAHVGFSDIDTVVCDEWVDFKALSDETSSGKMLYCDHPDYYWMALELEGFKFSYVMQKTQTSDVTDFVDNYKGAAIKVC